MSRIRKESPGLPYGSPHLPDKSDFASFLYSWLIFNFNYKFCGFSDARYGFWLSFRPSFIRPVKDKSRNLGGGGGVGLFAADQDIRSTLVGITIIIYFLTLWGRVMALFSK